MELDIGLRGVLIPLTLPFSPLADLGVAGVELTADVDTVGFFTALFTALEVPALLTVLVIPDRDIEAEDATRDNPLLGALTFAAEPVRVRPDDVDVAGFFTALDAVVPVDVRLVDDATGFVVEDAAVLVVEEVAGLVVDEAVVRGVTDPEVPVLEAEAPPRLALVDEVVVLGVAVDLPDIFI